MTSAGPPSRFTLRNFPSPKKARCRESGDQNGYAASSVPATSRAADPSSARTQTFLRPSGLETTNASRRPSGERSGAPLSTARLEFSGSSIDETTTRGGRRARVRARESDSERDHGDQRQGIRHQEEPLPGPAPDGRRRNGGGAGLRAHFRDRPQREHPVGRRLPTVLRILREARLDDAVERGRRERLNGRDRRRLRVQDRADQRGLGLAREGLPPRRHLVENGTEGEEVGPWVGFLSLERFGGHVLERA